MYNYWRYSHIYTGKCENYEFTCGNGKCLSKYLRCLGGNDCGDNSDEQQCRKCVFTNTSVLYCNHLSSGLMANSTFIQVSLYLPCQDTNRYSLSISPFFFNHQRNHNSNFNVDQIGKMIFVLIFVTTDYIVCLAPLSIWVVLCFVLFCFPFPFFFIFVCLFLTAIAMTKSWSLNVVLICVFFFSQFSKHWHGNTSSE